MLGLIPSCVQEGSFARHLKSYVQVQGETSSNTFELLQEAKILKRYT